MRLREPTLTAVVFAAAALALIAGGCKDSNSVAGPSTGISSPAVASIAGTWTGTFRPDSRKCSESAATASFQQTGAEVTGTFLTGSCGVTGRFHGTLRGNELTGQIAMQGCTGGVVSGNVSGPAVSLTVGDVTRLLVTGNEDVMYYGGVLSLHR